MQRSSECLLICLICIFSLVECCDITATLTSQTYHQVFAQFTFHDGRKSPVFTFNTDGQEQKVRITGQWCNMKPTRLDTYKIYPTPGMKPCATSQAFIEGYGFVNYIILSDGVFMGAKAGVACAAGDCGASRG